MISTSALHDSTLLTTSAVYRIDAGFYRFILKDPYASLNAPRYIFRPLPGQRRKADLVLNHKRLVSRVYRIDGMKANANITVKSDHIQLSLF